MPMVGDIPKIIGYDKPGAEYDIMCHDMVLDAAKVYEVMGEDTKFIGLLRDPVHHFKALWDVNRHKVNPTRHTTQLICAFSGV